MKIHDQVWHTVPSWVPSIAQLSARLTVDRPAKTWHAPLLSNILPLDATDDAIYAAADEAARACYKICALMTNADAIKFGIEEMCSSYGVPFPAGDTDGGIIARSLDKAWWLRNLRKEHGRRFEHEQIRRGVVCKNNPYISKESALKQRKRNAENAALLDNIVLENENGQQYTVGELAALGMANKANRRGELMTRIRGFEEIANELGHVSVFATITCPSKFHAAGGDNKKYDGSTPRQGQAHLVNVWACIRAACHRRGIRPYGFRIAEPHTDGCPHWHLLLWVPAHQLDALNAIITKHALSVDGNEAGAQQNRVKLVRIEAGKGSAAGYIIKYVCKNVDGIDDHKDRDGWTVAPDLLADGTIELTPSQRVSYWSQKHGIRQFQQIGGAPVGVWRELRRIREEKIIGAPEEITAAWRAVQKTDTGEKDEQGKPIMRLADYAAYLRAQGGVLTGRACAIRLKMDKVTVKGKYEPVEAKKPIGVYAVSCADKFYEAVHYKWTVKGRKSVDIAGAGAGFDLPRTGVNNCTRPGKNAPWTQPEFTKNKFFSDVDCPNLADQTMKPPTQEEINRELFLKHRKDGAEKFRKQHLANMQEKHAEKVLNKAEKNG
jgi:hypothetical protein